MNEDFVIEVSRIGVQKEGGHVFGLMTIKNEGVEVKKFDTLERGGNYTNLKIGDYEMHHSIKHKGRPVKCLRPTELFITSILIHDALNDDAKQLEGCIAPFIFGNDYKGSGQAMEQLWEVIGGYDNKQKKTIKLKIINNVPGEIRTKEQWMAQRKKAWETAHQK